VYQQTNPRVMCPNCGAHDVSTHGEHVGCAALGRAIAAQRSLAGRGLTLEAG